MTVSRTRYYKWLNAYSEFKYGCLPDEGRDEKGKWLIFKSKYDREEQSDFLFNMKKLNILDLFSGIGGFKLGFREKLAMNVCLTSQK